MYIVIKKLFLFLALRAYVDKRITLAELKKELEFHVGVGADCFKVSITILPMYVLFKVLFFSY